MLKKLTNNVKKFYTSENFNENILFLFLLSVIIFIFVYGLRNVALAEHDEVMNYIVFRTNSWADAMETRVNMGLFRGRLSFSNLALASIRWLVINSGSMAVYTLSVYLPIIVNVIVLALIISKRTNKYFGLLMVALYFSFAQINFQINLFVAFPIVIHFYFLMFLISAEFFLRYFERAGKYDLQISAFFLFVSFFGYESFLTYFALFPAYIFFCSVNDKTMKQLHRSLLLIKFHFIAVILYLVNYLIQTRIFAPEIHYDGATIDFYRLGFRSILTVLSSFALDLFPLLDFFRHDFIQTFSFSSLDIGRIIMAFCTTLICCLLLTKNIAISGKKVALICLISLIAIFVYPLPHSLTVLFHDHIAWGGTGGIPSFFGYYWIIVIIALLITYANAKLKFNKLFLIIIAPIVFITTIFTAHANDHFIRIYEANTVRYRAFSNLFSSSFAANVECGAKVYVRGYVGIYGDLTRLSQYTWYLTGRAFHFTNDLESLEGVENSYFLKYCLDNEFIMLGKTNTGLVGDELFALPTEPIINGGFIGTKSLYASMVTINDGEFTSVHNQSINIPIPYIGLEGILVEASGLIFENTAITSTLIVSNEIQVIPLGSVITVETGFHNTLIYGWSFLEHWGVWNVGNRAEIGLTVALDEEVDLEVDFNLFGFSDPTYFAINVNGQRIQEASVTPDGHSFVVPIPYALLIEQTSGLYDINVKFEIEIPDIPPTADHRELGIALSHFSINKQ